MKTIHVDLTFIFDEARLSEQELHDRLDARVRAEFGDADDVHTRWNAMPADSPLLGANAQPEELAAYLITRLRELLMRADGLSAMLMTHIEEAPSVSESQAGTLAEENRVESRKLGAIEDEETIRSQLVTLIEALKEIPS